MRRWRRYCFPLFDQIVIAPIHTARAAALQDLLAAAEATGTPATVADSVAQALKLAKEQLGERQANPGQIVVSGSVYLVGEARSLLLNESGAQP